MSASSCMRKGQEAAIQCDIKWGLGRMRILEKAHVGFELSLLVTAGKGENFQFNKLGGLKNTQ